MTATKYFILFSSSVLIVIHRLGRDMFCNVTDAACFIQIPFLSAVANMAQKKNF